MAHFEGSQLGMYLKNLKSNDRDAFDQIMARAEDNKKKNNSNKQQSIMREAGQKYDESPTILIGVISSRANFGIRVKSIVDTWGQPQNIPDGVLVRFFVGGMANESNFSSKIFAEFDAFIAQATQVLYAGPFSTLQIST